MTTKICHLGAAEESCIECLGARIRIRTKLIALGATPMQATISILIRKATVVAENASGWHGSHNAYTPDLSPLANPATRPRPTVHAGTLTQAPTSILILRATSAAGNANGWLV